MDFNIDFLIQMPACDTREVCVSQPTYLSDLWIYQVLWKIEILMFCYLFVFVISFCIYDPYILKVTGTKPAQGQQS